MLTIYPGMTNSPPTVLSAGIAANATTIPLLDASVLPAPPNLATIGTDTDAETILYTGKSGNNLTGVTRGYDVTGAYGVAKAWSAGTLVARNFTNKDLFAIRDNFDYMLLLDQAFNTHAADGTSHTSIAENTIISNASAHMADLNIHAQVYNVKNYGAVGNGIKDDTVAIQAAITAACVKGGIIYFPDQGPYNISSMLTATPGTAVTILNDPEDDYHFSNFRKVVFYSPSKAELKATASMVNMLKVSSTGYAVVDGLQFNGDSKVTGAALWYDWSIHTTTQNCAFWQCTRGVDIGASAGGYGVAEIRHNVFKTDGTAILAAQGDNYIEYNDFYVKTSQFGIDIGLGGNTTIARNVFTRAYDQSGAVYGVRLSGNYDASKEIRDVVIRDNEFCGIDYGVFGYGYSTSDRNVYSCIITGNHVKSYGSSNTNRLFGLTYCTDIDIHDNIIGAQEYGISVQKRLGEATDCDNLKIHDNIVTNTSDDFVVFTNVTRSMIENNKMLNVGKLGADYPALSFWGASTDNVIKNNYMYQSSASYAQNFLAEHDTSGNNYCENNFFTGITTPYSLVSNALTSVASVATLTLPLNGSVFSITGTTGITSITASWPGREVTLVFASTPTVTNGGNLKLAGDFSASADDVLRLVSDGTNWIEVSRSAN